MLPHAHFSIISLRVLVDTSAAHASKTGIRRFCLVLLHYLVSREELYQVPMCSITHFTKNAERASRIYNQVFLRALSCCLNVILVDNIASRFYFIGEGHDLQDTWRE